MVKGLIWSAEAETDFKKTLHYIKNEWGTGAAAKFSNRVFERLDKLVAMPSVAKATSQKGIWMYKLDRKNVLFFTIQDHFIILLSIYPYKKDIQKSQYF